MNSISLYDISWKVSEDEYRADKAYSYSTIARFNREGFNNLHKLFDKIDTPSLLFGSMVDTLLTDGPQEFNNRFEVADLPNNSDSIISITRELFNTYSDIYRKIESIPNEEVALIGEKHNYYANPKYAGYRAKRIKDEGSRYYNLLFISRDKTLVSTKDYNDANDCAYELRSNPATKWYFASNNPFDPEIERFYQLKFKGEYEDIPLRCMADLIIVDHKHKTIIPCDLKTSSKPEWEFYKSFIEWNYWIQAQLYWYIIRQALDKDELYKDYYLTNYRFIVINRCKRKPLVWEYEGTTQTEECIYGSNGQYRCRNWRDIVKELHYYLTYRPEYPLGIVTGNNCITSWLNKE